MSAKVVVTAPATTPVKGLRIVAVSELRLAPAGVPDDRRFHLIDDRRRLVNGKHIGTLGTDRGRAGAMSLMSRASLARLEQVAGGETVDGRRFRMHVEIAGVGEHEEDAWLGSALRIGQALVRVRGHIGRCSTTQRHPVSGERDLPTLDILRSYRAGLDTTEPLAFGVHCEVLEAGTVALGDLVERL